MSEIFSDEKIEKPLVILEANSRLLFLRIDTIFWSVGGLSEVCVMEIQIDVDDVDDMQSEKYILLLELF